jgi:hypothetical protein
MTSQAIDIRIKKISANTPPGMLTVSIPHAKQRKLLLYIGIERVPQQSGPATGTVDVYVKWIGFDSWSKLDSVDLAASDEPNVQDVQGTYTDVKLVLNNVVGEFNLSIIGY